tara:strand:- start:8733 stop:9125 length:393 start_codon:yes stop_codon:yes gene_type:complete
MNNDEDRDDEEISTALTEDLKPKKPSMRAPQGIRTFTVCRQSDETGISGDGVVIEGATFATGHTVIHWLTPAPRGSIAFFDAFDDFIKIHVSSHPTNNTIITFEDGEQLLYKPDGSIVKNSADSDTEQTN